jgi:hypothetical protein
MQAIAVLELEEKAGRRNKKNKPQKSSVFF